MNYVMATEHKLFSPNLFKFCNKKGCNLKLQPFFVYILIRDKHL